MERRGHSSVLRKPRADRPRGTQRQILLQGTAWERPGDPALWGGLPEGRNSQVRCPRKSGVSQAKQRPWGRLLPDVGRAMVKEAAGNPLCQLPSSSLWGVVLAWGSGGPQPQLSIHDNQPPPGEQQLWPPGWGWGLAPKAPGRPDHRSLGQGERAGRTSLPGPFSQRVVPTPSVRLFAPRKVESIGRGFSLEVQGEIPLGRELCRVGVGSRGEPSFSSSGP